MSKKEENKETIQYYSGKKTIFHIIKKNINKKKKNKIKRKNIWQVN